MHWEPHAFALPNLPSGYIWHQVLDTAEDSMNGFLPSGKERHLDDQKEALVLARSIQVFAGLKCPEKKKHKAKVRKRTGKKEQNMLNEAMERFIKEHEKRHMTCFLPLRRSLPHLIMRKKEPSFAVTG